MAATPLTLSKTSDVFQFQPFSNKQLKVLSWWVPKSPFNDYDGIIADGAIRSGKTVSMETSFMLWAMNTFNGKNFALCGKTIGSLNRNVLRDFKRIAVSRGYEVTDKRSEHLIVISGNGVENYFYYFGGRDEASQDLIQGMTLAGVLFDEVALMPESFVNQATGRCSVEGSKYWFNCNPQGRMHWFKLNWINKYVEKRLLYLHFTMEDNLSLSEQIKDRYRRMYTGVFYNRYILGRWCVAEGVIYDCFDSHINLFDSTVERPWENDLYNHYIGVDYGTTNPTVFLECYDDGDTFWIVREYYQDPAVDQKQKTTSEHADDLEAFLSGDLETQVIVDPAAEDFKLELKNRGFRVKNANNDVLEGIRTVAAMMHMGALKIDKSCVRLRAELETYVWDQKAKERGEEKPVKQKDHAMDAMRYIVKTLTNRTRMDRVARNREEAA